MSLYVAGEIELVIGPIRGGTFDNGGGRYRRLQHEMGGRTVGMRSGSMPTVGDMYIRIAGEPWRCQLWRGERTLVR